ncbi:MAG TPA: hypothetical protein VLF39_00500 [Candidatus Saccharimonadales bacterium]|nr:hypothetical protein [Candidatus Saccharimonadales bacterium]
MKPKALVNIVAMAALSGGIAAAGEAKFQSAYDHKQVGLAGDCSDLLTDQLQLKVKSLPDGCDQVDSNLIVTVRQEIPYVPGDYTLPVRQVFETEQADYHQQRVEQFDKNVIEFGVGGFVLVGLGELALAEMWRRNQKIEAVRPRATRQPVTHPVSTAKPLDEKL